MFRKIIYLILISICLCNSSFAQENENAALDLFYYFDGELEKIDKEIAVLESEYKESPSATVLFAINQSKLKKEVLNIYGSKAVKRSLINILNFSYFSASSTFLTKQKELEEKYDIKINLSADKQTLEEIKGLGVKVLKTTTKNETSSNNRRIDIDFHAYMSDLTVGYKISLSEPISTELAGKATFEEHTYQLPSSSSSELVTTKFMADLEAFLSVLHVKLDSKNISQLWDLRNESDSSITFMSPAGKPFTLLLKKLSKVGFSYNDEDLQTSDKYDFFADGSLQSFTYDNINYVRCRLEKHRESFDGYYIDGSSCQSPLIDKLSKKITTQHNVVVVYACVVNGELKFKANKVPVSASVSWPSENHDGSGTFLQNLPIQFSAMTGAAVELSAAALTSTYSADSKRFLEALNICDRDYIPYAITVANLITLCPKIISQCYSLERLINDFDLSKHLLSASNNSSAQSRTPLQQYQDKVVMLLQRIKELRGYANNTINTDNQTKNYTTASQVTDYVNDASNICALNFISNAERLRLLKILATDGGYGTHDAIVRLFETINLELSDANIIAFFDGLTNSSNNCGSKSLITKIYSVINLDDYTRLNKALCIKFKSKEAVIHHYFPSNTDDEFKMVLYYDDSYLLQTAPIGTHKYSASINDNGSVSITKQVVDYQTIEILPGDMGGPTPVAHWTLPVTFTLSPFTPITIVNRSSLSSITDATSQSTLTIAPALFLKFAVDKTFNDDALKVTATAMDLLSLATGPGMVWKAYSAGRMGLALYEGAQVVGSLANLTANGLPENSEVKKWIDEFNLVISVWGGAKILSNPKIYNTNYFNLVKQNAFVALDKSQIQNLIKRYTLIKNSIVQQINNSTVSKKVDDVIAYLGRLVKASVGYSDLRRFPEIRESIIILQDLKKNNKLVHSCGVSTEIELAALHRYTANGNFLNVPMRKEGPLIFDEYAGETFIAISSCLKELRKTTRLYTENVYRGRTYSLQEFNSLFNNNLTEIPLYGFVSTTKNKNVALDFISKTANGLPGEKVKCLLKIKPKNGVDVDDISDWGTNLVLTQHPNNQAQLEVLLEEGYFKIIGIPTAVKENGMPKFDSDGTPWMEIQLEELAKKIR